MKCELRYFSTVFYLLSSFIILLCTEGYQFGSGDQSEMLSYATWLRDPGLYPEDFYIQSIVHELPNERWPFSQLIAYAGRYTEVSVFGLFCLTTMMLLLGLYSIVIGLLPEKYHSYSWWIVLTAIIPLNGISLGENELYYNYLLPGSLALSIGVWAWYFWLNDRYWPAYLLLIPATFFHPMNGFHIFLLFAGVGLLRLIKTAVKPEKKEFAPALVYILLVFPWLILILLHFGNGHVSGDDFLKIIRFRLAHHFYPSVFPLKNYIIIGSLLTIALLILNVRQFERVQRKRATLNILFWLTITGVFIYTIGLELFQMPFFITTQWFSVILWLKTFSIILLSGAAISFLHEKNWLLPNKVIAWALPVATLICLIFSIWGSWIFQHREYQFPWHSPGNDKVISILCRENTDINALFLVPPDFTAFPYYSQRSNFISYKQMVHKKQTMKAWYQRVQMVYGPPDKPINDPKMEAMMYNWSHRNEAWFLDMKDRYGITHVLTYKSHQLPFVLVAENAQYQVYRL